MTPLAEWFRPPRHWMLLFLGITLALAAAQAWLGWRILGQDRDLESRRIQERHEQLEDGIRTDLSEQLSKVDGQLSQYLGVPREELAKTVEEPPEGALIVVFEAADIQAFPARRLAYYPFVAQGEEPPASYFSVGEDLEFQRGDPRGAAEEFRRQARSEDAAVRAGSLIRLARVLRKARQNAAALEAYGRLAALGSTPVFGWPAELVARDERCRMTGDGAESLALIRDLDGGRWRVSRPVYEFFRGGLRERVKNAPEAPVTLASGVEAVRDEWERIRKREANPQGFRTEWIANQSVLLVWRSTPYRMVALVAGPRWVEEQVVRRMAPEIQRNGTRLAAFTDTEGHPVVPSIGGMLSQRALAKARQSGLPWGFQIESADRQSELGQLLGRRRLLLAGMGLMTLLMLAGSYFIARAVTRELQVARLQSDFVAAVSHEFRSPLTSMRQLTEMLAKGRVPSPERREQYYQVLERESARLHRLVESLLDFGRMEAGKRQYTMEPLDGNELVRAVAAEFSNEMSSRGYQVEVSTGNAECLVRADREALTCALWNLLDNAVKYSPDCRTVWVEAGCETQRFAVSVRDRGVGIPAEEQARIFQKFVRGASAQTTAAKGTGVGLTIANHIVRAHGGEIRLTSKPSEGSTFTILLPRGD